MAKIILPVKQQDEIKLNEQKHISLVDVFERTAPIVVPATKHLVIRDNGEHLYIDPKTNEIRSSDFNFGKIAKISSERTIIFKKSTKCICCGLEGQYFRKTAAINNNRISYHVDMYAIYNGNEILFTKDHLLPKSQGGHNSLNNYATCCVECNRLKGNSLLSWDNLRTLFTSNEYMAGNNVGNRTRQNVQERILANF